MSNKTTVRIGMLISQHGFVNAMGGSDDDFSPNSVDELREELFKANDWAHEETCRFVTFTMEVDCADGQISLNPERNEKAKKQATRSAGGGG